ncbi:DEAD/DEAH box helicase [Peristeroidobacter soli]|uniref:DEAD/DEAH box helicase n=1 Tax=Peristeroidobacter soli TaxID=2497877 RepID=UPI001300ADC7|nr:DEAD/DEAH box helicase [Peristeroidobacter soli]
MKPEFNSRRLFGITRSTGKMYEFDLPKESHVVVPPHDEPESLFVLTVGNLGDAAASLNEGQLNETQAPSTLPVASDDLQFAASFFDAFLASRFRDEISRDVTLLAASAYYLAHRPGSSFVLAERLPDGSDDAPVTQVLRWILRGRWESYPTIQHQLFGDGLQSLVRLIAYHFYDGSGRMETFARLAALRAQAYARASARELLFIDLIASIARIRLTRSAWTTLPVYTGIAVEAWRPIIGRTGFPKELWPAQVRLGEQGIFAGRSGVIQMPTSAGKTKSVEIILRAAFLAGRTQLAVVVAPFRALCHEIAASLHGAFKADGVTVNELSDVLQRDFLSEFAELLGPGYVTESRILVLTPEKFLYVLRQVPEIVDRIGVVVYDEGHQFDTGSRGITYELLLTQIKSLLPSGAQTILISAVVRNAQALSQWLIGDGATVVDGAGLHPTSKAYAFASWMDQLGQLMFFESTNFTNRDYFVPRAIEQQQLAKLSSREKDRYFPDRGSSTETAKDVSLYLAIRLASKGACAIFCGRKDTAAGMARRIVEIYKRGYSLPAPAIHADQNELGRLVFLIDRHFGDQSMEAQGARRGLFVHHNNTPHGLRLAIEHAMQHRLIPLVACTSTLAQGVNLPIRYLIVSGIYQGAERIKTRDFQNLVGRAGRAGIHTEGVIIFSDPSVYDRRRSRDDGWRFKISCELLSGDNAEDTSSSLLGLVAPIGTPDDKSELLVPADNLCQLIYSSEPEWVAWAAEVVRLNPAHSFTVDNVVAELRRRRVDIVAIESYLMANRGQTSFPEFAATVEQLARGTLAYHLANDDQKSALTVLFQWVARYIEAQASAVERQAVYGKTLLGVIDARLIEQWVAERRDRLLELTSPEEWLAAVWPMFAAFNRDKFFHTVTPAALAFQLTGLWMQGKSFREILQYCRAQKGSKPWGEEQRRALAESDVLDFLQNTLSFECSLIVAAIEQFLFESASESSPVRAGFRLFQKSMTYGLPDELAIAAFEYGFSDRMLAQDLRDVLGINESKTNIRALVAAKVDTVRQKLLEYPSYFEAVLNGRI